MPPPAADPKPLDLKPKAAEPVIPADPVPAPVPPPPPAKAPIALVSGNHLDLILGNASSRARALDIPKEKVDAFCEVARAVLPALGSVIVPGTSDVLVVSVHKV